MIKIAAPVYKFENPNTDAVLILHKSTKHRPGLGIWQVTFFNPGYFFEGGAQPDPVGDSEFGSLEDAQMYLEEQGYHLVDKVEDQQEIHALFKLKPTVGIVDMFYESNPPQQRSGIDRGQNVTLVDRDALGDQTSREEITQLEDEKVGDDTTNRTQEH